MTDEPPAALQIEGLAKTFFTTRPPAQVLDGIDMEVVAGEFLAVMGASGSGKSTLLYNISGMDRPTSGTVRLEGRDLTSLDDTEMSRIRLTMMGFIFQQPYFLNNLNVEDNILLPALKAAPEAEEAAIARTAALLERFDIAHVGRHAITEVSGGQLQRAALCRALVCQPSILFADEPTGALNATMTEEVMDSLSEVHSEATTIVMVTHDPKCASRADRVIYLRDGIISGSQELGPWSPGSDEPRTDALNFWLSELGF